MFDANPTRGPVGEGGNDAPASRRYRMTPKEAETVRKISTNKILQEEFAEPTLMKGFERFMAEVETYLAFWAEARS